MYILGISCHYHDSAAALLKDGTLVAAAQEERFTRIKNDPAFPEHAINFCLSQAGIGPSDVDYAVFYEKPFLKTARLLTSVAATFPRSWQLFRKSMGALLKEKLWIKEYIRRHLNRYFPHSFQRTSFVPCRQRVLCLTVQRGSNSDGRRSGGVGNCHNGARAGLLGRWDDQLD